jgi:hypothetical protein
VPRLVVGAVRDFWSTLLLSDLKTNADIGQFETEVKCYKKGPVLRFRKRREKCEPIGQEKVLQKKYNLTMILKE